MPFSLKDLLTSTVSVVLGLAMFASAAEAQPPTPPDAPSASRPSSPHIPVFSTLAQKSIVFPDIATSEGSLSTSEKFKLFVNNSISLGAIAGAATGAGFSQAFDSPEGFGQGGEGYAERFGASMARNATTNFFGTFLLASALHQDPRFFPEVNPTLGGSVKYSIQRVFITRTDSGKDTTNWSGLLAPLISEGIANSYYPQSERTAGDTFQRYGIDIATTIGANMFRNYWPVFFKRLRR